MTVTKISRDCRIWLSALRFTRCCGARAWAFSWARVSDAVSAMAGRIGSDVSLAGPVPDGLATLE
jgi:hypothetical protein